MRRAYVVWRSGLLRRACVAVSLLGCSFRSWKAYVLKRLAGTKGAYVLEGLREVGHDWLMATLGDVLPALLPEGSPIAKAAEQELRLIESALARTSGGRGGAGGGAGGGEGVAGAAEAEMIEVRARTQQRLVSLASGGAYGAEGGGGGMRLLAIARGLDTQVAQWQRTNERLTSGLADLAETSGRAEERLTSELGLLQAYVVEQTKSYLNASASRSAQSKEVDEQLNQLVETASVFAERLMTVDRQLMRCVDSSYAAELSRQLGVVASTKAGREEVQQLIDHLKPTLSIKQLSGPYVVVEESTGRKRAIALPSSATATAMPAGRAGAGLSLRARRAPTRPR